MMESEKVVRRCIGGSHGGENIACGPGDYVHLRHREDPRRRERYEIKVGELHYLYDVGEDNLPLTDALRGAAGYESLKEPKKRGKAK